MKYYLIGIKGAGMATLANILFDLGNSVCGYDDCTDYKFTMKGLNERGINIYSGDTFPNLDKDTIVTYTAAINESHHEVKRVKDLGYKIISYHELIGSLTKQLNSICVCGTHGKTTTSLMISNILSSSIGCSYFVGDGSGYGNKNSDLFVLESCEYNKHFLSYNPDNVVLTNIELDHTETYPTIDDMINTYQEFVDKCENFVIACGDDLNILKLKTKKVYYYGFNDNNDLIIKNKQVIDGKTNFSVYFKGKFFDEYSLPLFGDHLILDSLAAILVGIMFDVKKDIIKQALINYQPASRRFNEEIIGDIVIVDDYAHHPTEIKVTYNSAKEKYSDKEIVAIFLPNTYSRTKDLFDDFVKALSIYDKVYLMEIKSDREKKEDYPDVSSSNLAERISNSEIIDYDNVNNLLKHHNAVMCFMSCANITPMINAYRNTLKNNI